MKMTKDKFFKWASKRIQYTENDFLSPHNKDIADSEIVEVISWKDFASLCSRIIDGDIEIIEQKES